MFTRLFRLPLMLFIFPSLEPLWNSLEQLQTIPATEIVSCVSFEYINLLHLLPLVYCTCRGYLQLLGWPRLRYGEPEAQGYRNFSV